MNAAPQPPAAPIPSPPPAGLLPALPVFFWALPLLAAAAWWPIEPWWQSDDFLAVHYVQDGRAVLHDFVGAQYGATDIWAFWRPLITASFWLEQRLGGAFPPLSHVSNVLAHATSALLVGLVWRRFLPAGAAFAAALLWSLSPSHTGAIAWAAGRVDSHSTVWCLLALLLVLRAHERAAASATTSVTGSAAGRPRSWPAAVATALALASKELAVVVPALATLLVFVRTRGGTVAARAAYACRATAGPWLVLALWLPLRWLALGRFGGYDAAALDPAATLAGLAKGAANLAAPARWVPLPDWVSMPAVAWVVAGALPVVVAAALGVLRAPRLAAVAIATAGVCLVPVASLLAAADNPQTMRYWYVPAAALCGVLAAGGRWPVVAVLLAWAGPVLAMRGEQCRADRESAAIHRAALATAARGATAPLFVAGLPQANRSGTAIQLNFGVDRLLAPPFTDARVPLYALRPLALGPDVFALSRPGEAPWALPAGSTWNVDRTPGADGPVAGLVAVAPGRELPELAITGDTGGTVDLTTPVLDSWYAHAEAWLREPGGPRLTTPGVRAPFHRLTVFTAGGYLATLCENHAPEGAADGALYLFSWFVKDPLEARRFRIGHTSPGTYIGDGLGVPTTIDLSTEFPALLEAGTLDLSTLVFTPTHRARRLVWLRFDRSYPAWVRRAQGQPR